MNKTKISAAQIEREIELARMMAEDMDKVFRKYAKSALEAENRRTEKIRNERFMGCATERDLQDIYGYAGITEDEYYAGLEFLESREERKKQLSIVELHRRNVKDIRDRWKGTVRELQAELNELNGVIPDARNAFEKSEAAERADRAANMNARDM